MKQIIKAVVFMFYALIVVLIISAVVSIAKIHAQENQIRSFTGYEDCLKVQYPRMPGEWFRLIETECGSDVPVAAVCALIDTESEWQQFATSPAGAMGPTQLMPGTARMLDVSDPYDWRQNIRGGIRHFRLCMARANGDIPKAFMKYHAGPAREAFPRISEDYARKCVGKMLQTERRVIGEERA